MCRAKGCGFMIPEDKIFCVVHWEMVPGENKVALMDSYGTRSWARNLQGTIQTLFLAESQAQDPVLTEAEPPDDPWKADLEKWLNEKFPPDEDEIQGWLPPKDWRPEHDRD